MQGIDFFLALSNAFYHIRLMLNFIKINPALLLAEN
jgi:hypothetical protein